MKILVCILRLIAVVSLLGCSSGLKNAGLIEVRSDSDFFAHAEKVDEGFKLIEANKYDQARGLFSDFLSSNTKSRHSLAAMYGLGLSCEMMEDWTSANQAYRQLVDRSSTDSYEYQALAYYHLSFVYEAQGEPEKAISSLMDAMKLKNYLPLEVAKAEIPARVGAFYAQVGEFALADRYLVEAEAGLREIKSSQRPSAELNKILAKSLWHMGYFSLNQLNEENIERLMVPLARSQKYLLQAIETQEQEWGRAAYQKLVQNYNRVFDFIENLQVVETQDWIADNENNWQKKARFAGFLSESIEILKSFQLDESNSVYEELNAYLDALNRKVNTVLIRGTSPLPMTTEALELQSIKKVPLHRGPIMGSVKAPLIDNALPDGIKAKLPRRSEDPNLDQDSTLNH